MIRTRLFILALAWPLAGCETAITVLGVQDAGDLDSNASEAPGVPEAGLDAEPRLRPMPDASIALDLPDVPAVPDAPAAPDLGRPPPPVVPLAGGSLDTWMPQLDPMALVAHMSGFAVSFWSELSPVSASNTSVRAFPLLPDTPEASRATLPTTARLVALEVTDETCPFVLIQREYEEHNGSSRPLLRTQSVGSDCGIGRRLVLPDGYELAGATVIPRLRALLVAP